VVDVARYDVNDLSEAFLKAMPPAFAAYWTVCKAEGEGLPLVLAVLGNEIRTLYRLAAGLAARVKRLADLMQEASRLGQPPSLVERTLKFPVGTPGLGHARPVPLDRAAKGLLREDAWDELKQLGLALMHRAGPI
jgi:DNA polymerase-3 subunit delta